MLIAHLFDRFSLGTLFILTFLLMAVFLEAGFHLGRVRQGKPVKAQTAQVRAIMGATLGLLAFMMAFTFATAQRHYEIRVQNMVEEARIASNAFLQADFLEEPHKSRARNMLREYIGGRLKMNELVKGDRMADDLVQTK